MWMTSLANLMASHIQPRRLLALGAFLSVGAFGTFGCSQASSGPACAVTSDGISAAPLTGTSLNEKQLVFTFDHVPSVNTADISTYLGNRKVKATFFIEGQKLTHPELLDTLRNAGHLVANGTFSYTNLVAAPKAVTELRLVDRQISPYVSGNIFLFRAPENVFSPDLASYLNSQGLQKYVGPIGWDVASSPGGEAIDMLCWRTGVQVKDCAQTYIAAIAQQRKGIVRFTDTELSLPDLLRELVPLLEAGGYTFARLDEIPDVRRGLFLRGATPGTVAGNRGCDDYSK